MDKIDSDNIIIAIDGPSGTGKSTTAKELAKRLNFKYLDTGAMYRAVTLYFLKNNIDIPDNENAKVNEILKNIEIKFDGENTFLNSQNVSYEIRSNEVNNNVSKIAKIKEIRDFCGNLQRKIGLTGKWVVEGRDIGTAIFPEAKYKFFLYASDEERAKRRWLQDGKKDSYEKVLQNIKERDTIDSSREMNPLRKAPDAIEIDTTNLNFDEVVNKIISYIKI
ncbi:MAG: (d)CMP kinase [Spirochaetes bacterium]|nr:(d)CMP kinase [Spirochaetota bacterium]